MRWVIFVVAAGLLVYLIYLLNHPATGLGQ
jgi:hypothetical protein